MKRWWIIMFVVAVLAIVGGAGYLGSRSVQAETTPGVQAPPIVPVTRGAVAQTITAPGKLVGTQQVNLTSDVSGQVAALNVRAGDRVEAGDVLAELATDDLTQAVAKAEIALRQVELELEKLQQPVDQSKLRATYNTITRTATSLGIAQAERNQTMAADLYLNGLANARITVKDKQEWYDSRLKLYEQGELNYGFLDLAQNELKSAQDHLQQLEAQANLGQRTANSKVLQNAQEYQEAMDALNSLQAGKNPLDVEAAQLRVQTAQIERDEAQAKLDAATVRAPFDGVVLKVAVSSGETINAGSELLTLSNPQAVEIEASVIEEDYPLAAVGQAVELFFDAQPDTLPMGSVARVVPQRLSGDRPLYPIIISINETLPESLVPGMTVDASIILDAHADVLRLPRAVVRTRSDGTAQIKVWDGRRVTERDVSVGLRGDAYVEILSGLTEGEQVVAE